VLELYGVQTIHKFDCHCDRIHADEFRIIPDLSYCNDSEDISDVSTIHYPLNLAYLTEYYSREELFNLTADMSLNDTVHIDLPNLAIVEQSLDARFADEETAAFDMAMVINSTKTSAKVFDNLAHYLFNEMITAQDSAGDFDFFSPWTWFTIIGWIVAVALLILVIMFT